MRFGQLGPCTRRLQEIEKEIRKVRKLESRLRSHRAGKTRRAERERVAAEQKNLRDEQSLEYAGRVDYDRHQFLIRDKDYKRGNSLDNYCRNTIYGDISRYFGDACVNCGSTYDLTLDHFGIPKNEGGNYILKYSEGGYLKLNVVLLCRSCNSAKGERPYREFFSAEVLEKAFEIHRHMMEWILSSRDAQKVIAKWYRMPKPSRPRLF